MSLQSQELFRVPTDALLNFINEPAVTPVLGDAKLQWRIAKAGGSRLWVITITNCRAYSVINDIHCGIDDVVLRHGLYEIYQSQYLNNIIKNTAANLRNQWVLRHFAIYFDEIAAFHFIGESAKLELPVET